MTALPHTHHALGDDRPRLVEALLWVWWRCPLSRVVAVVVAGVQRLWAASAPRDPLPLHVGATPEYAVMLRSWNVQPAAPPADDGLARVMLAAYAVLSAGLELPRWPAAFGTTKRSEL